MIKFETINGTLCRMVEPEPLTDDVKFPVAVEIFGKQHILKDKYQGFIPIVFAATYMDMSLHQAPFLCYLAAKIIGYPVADGSAEWRNYQLMQGKCVCCPGDSEYYQASGQGRIIGRLIENNEFNSTWNSNTFMRDDSDGWHLYEPQPKPLKVGDWVRRTHAKRTSYGRVLQITDMLQLEYTDGDKSWAYKHDCITIPPSEVVIRIGCLEGTVTYAISDDCFLLAKVCDPQHRACCIDMSMLDTATRELVESLLKAQEELR